MDCAVASLSEFIDRIKTARAAGLKDTTFFYRGQGAIHKSPTPKCFRNSGHRIAEREMLLHLFSQSPKDFLEDFHAFDRLVRAQHFGLPTRLLDVTFNPLTALYFAISAKDDQQGEVLIYSLPSQEMKFFNSDSVSCLSNLAFLSENEREDLRGAVRRVADDILGKPRPEGWPVTIRRDDPKLWESYIKKFNKEGVTRRLIQLIKVEKPYFESRIDPMSLNRIHAVIPKRNNMRIAAQSGAFFIFGLAEENPTIKSIDSISTIKIALGGNNSLLQELEAVGVNQSSVYPELDKIADAISKKEFMPN